MTDRLRSALLLFLLLAGSALQSFSILMLIPMLAAIGFNLDSTTGADSTASGTISVFVTAIERMTSTLPLGDPLLTILALFIAVLLLRDLVGYFSRVLNETLQQSFYVDLRSDLYEKLLHANWSSISKLKSHEIAYHLTTNMGAIANITRFSLQAITSVVTAFAFGIIALAAAPQLVMILVPIGLTLFVPMRYLMRRTHKQAQQLRDLSVAHEDRGQQFVKRHRHISNFDNQAAEAKSHAHSTQTVAQTRIAITRTQAFTSLLQSTVAALTLAGTVLLAIRVLHMSPANLLLLIFAASRLFPRLMQLQYQAQTIFVLLPAYESHAALTASLDTNLTGSNGKAITQIDRLHLPTLCLQNRLNLDAEPLRLARGEITCLIGPSGSGKSTLCDIVAGLLPNSVGGKIDHETISDETLPHLQRSVTYLEQGTIIWHHSVRDALTWANPNATEQELTSVLTQLGLMDRVASHPDGLDAPLGDAGHWLSGGELKRLALGQALLRDAPILILDEFTANLDDETEQMVMDIVARNKKKRITLIATHKPGPLRYADNIYRIDGKAPAQQHLAATPFSPTDPKASSLIAGAQGD
ncbi:MAG: ABC transporter ATP-binding protein [Alphaproteobacteria bacterium]